MKLQIQLTNEQTEALAQVLKRIRLDIIRGIAASDDEAYQALDALEIIMRELAEIGFNPR
jgi:chemotaxis signal transduction protein